MLKLFRLKNARVGKNKKEQNSPMRRNRRQKPPANHERWLVSYADFITLLFAFFVVLYSSAQVDKRKVGKLAMAIQVAFQELGAFPASTTQVPKDMEEPMPFNTVQAIENVDHTASLSPPVASPTGELSGQENGDLGALRRELEQSLWLEISRHEVALRNVPDGLVISLREIGFFASGSAEITAKSQLAFSRIAALLTRRPYRIRIEGHTDTVPIHNSQFGSNWELSTTRATELVRLLIEQYGFAAERLSAAGYAEFHPVASNSTADGRAQNRRVDVVILGKPAAENSQPPLAQP
jgi:chemotaxis protein MotB